MATNLAINQLISKTPASTDIIPVADPSTGIAGKSLISDIVNYGLPSQASSSGKFLTTNGATTSWADILGSVTYQGTWDASANSPSLASSVGTKGFYYVVSADGTTNLNGVNTWKVGDWAIYNGTVWQKVDNTDSVTSVNGYTGSVTLNYSDVGAPSANGASATGTWGIDVTGNSANVTGVVAIINGGTGKTTATDAINALLPDQSTNSGKFLTTNGANSSWSGVDLTSAVSGVLPVANGGTGTSNGSITGTGELTFQAGGSNEAVSVLPTGTGNVRIHTLTVSDYSNPGKWPYGAYSLIQPVQRSDSGDGGNFYVMGPNAKTSGAGGSVSIIPGIAAGGGARGWVQVDGVTISNNGKGIMIAIGATNLGGQGSVGVGWWAGNLNDPSSVTGRNVFIGYQAGYGTSGVDNNTAGTDQVCVGYRAYPNGSSDSNSIVIGYNAFGDGSNTAVIGNSSIIYCKLSGYTKTNSIQETVYTITDGASVDINPANGGIQVWDLGANRTPTATNFASGQSVTLMISDGTAYAVTWTSIGVTWVGGSAPTLATSGYSVIELWKRGSTIYGAPVGDVA